MKQVTYKIDWMTIAGAVVATHDVEDGFWKLDISTESVTTALPSLGEGSLPVILPGHAVRITGLLLTKVPSLEFMGFQVKDRLITEVGFDLNRNQSGPLPSGEGPGENS